MSKISVTELDQKLNSKEVVSCDTAIRRIVKHITKQIDNTFPEKQFLDWVNSDDEKPFKWNHNSYHWNAK